MEITFLGHSCFLIKFQNTELLIDPFITGNPKAEKVNIEDLNPDFILLSHGHQDHVLDAEAIATQSNATIIANYEIATWYESKGIKSTVGMNHGGNYVFKDGSIKFVPALHSSVLPDGSYGGNPVGFVIKAEGETIYYAGDTGLSIEMELIGRYEEPTVAILPLGDMFTMGIDDAIRCSDLVKCNKVVGMHFDTFPPIEIDKEESKRKFAAMNKELILMNVSESLTI